MEKKEKQVRGCALIFESQCLYTVKNLVCQGVCEDEIAIVNKNSNIIQHMTECLKTSAKCFPMSHQKMLEGGHFPLKDEKGSIIPIFLAWHDFCCTLNTAVSDLELFFKSCSEHLSECATLAFTYCCRGTERPEAVANMDMDPLVLNGYSAYVRIATKYGIILGPPKWKRYGHRGNMVFICFQRCPAPKLRIENIFDATPTTKTEQLEVIEEEYSIKKKSRANQKRGRVKRLKYGDIPLDLTYLSWFCPKETLWNVRTNERTNEMGKSSFLNNLGIISSTLCILDCAVLPVLLIGLSFMGIISNNLPVGHDHHHHHHHHDHHDHLHHHHDEHHHDEHAAANATNWIVSATASVQWFTHNVAFYFIIPLGALTLTLSFIQHRKFHVLLLGFLGISFLLSSHYFPQLLDSLSPHIGFLNLHRAETLNFFEKYHDKIEVGGSLLLLTAQLLNRKLCACDDHAHGSHGHSHGNKKSNSNSNKKAGGSPSTKKVKSQ
eukprot:TRINITY_DN3028_c2_g1_i2.p1 TRINITY_DN3028_c2_g1~~TRINITY_DN3028_c2_g1_i2.p1  ORF type:complete len:565 (-),score=117.80 TRINITY_DN3028_c2_g1_i2:1130-2605(-)